jgi:phytanoyl-CoA hydroxylase
MMAVTTQPISEELYVNDGKLQSHQIAILHPSHPDEPLEKLRERFQKDGYLFLKGLLPRDDVFKARQEYFNLIAPSGVLAPGTTPIEGIFDKSKSISDFPGIGAGPTDESIKPSKSGELFLELARQAHTEDWYAKTFCHLPALKSFIAKFTNWGEDTMQLRRSLLRNNIPGSKAIGPHYDQIFLRYGDTTNLTAWVPMGDISINGGGLIYLEGSMCTLSTHL